MSNRVHGPDGSLAALHTYDYGRRTVAMQRSGGRRDGALESLEDQQWRGEVGAHRRDGRAGEASGCGDNASVDES
jgi:hypothetical protein